MSLVYANTNDAQALSYDLGSGQYLSGKFLSNQNLTSSLALKMFLASELCSLIEEDKIKADTLVDMKPEFFSKLEKTTSHILPKNEKISVSEIIKGLVLLQSDEAAALALEILKKPTFLPDTQEKSILRDLTLDQDTLIKVISNLCSGLKKLNFDFFSPQADIQGEQVPSRIKLVSTDNSQIAIVGSDEKDIAFAIAYVSNPNFPDHIRKVLAIIWDPSEKDKAKDLSLTLSEAVNNFETLKVFDKGKEILTVPVIGSQTRSVPLVTKQEIFITVSKSVIDENKNRGNPLEVIVERNELIKAPHSISEPFGKVNILLGGKVINSFPLYPKEEIEANLTLLPRIFRTFEKIFRKDYDRSN